MTAGFMDPLSGLFEELRALREKRATGTLVIDSHGQKRKLYLRDGDLHLPASHPLAQQFHELVSGLGESRVPDPQSRAQALELVLKIATVLASWRRHPRVFEPGVRDFPADLVGPLPTAQLIMAAATSGLDEAGVEKEMKGMPGRWLAAPDADRRTDALGFSPEQAFVLERLRHPMSVEEALERSPVPRGDLLRALFSLIAIRAVRSEQDVSASAPSGETDLVAKLSERIARSLAEHPLDLGEQQYRDRVTELLARHGGLNHYELLGIPASAGNDQIQAAFERLARLAHPSNATRFGNPGSESALVILFERATLAYETLMDPERRRVYNQRELIELPAAREANGARRDEERREIGREQYQRAQAYANAGDVHNAILLLERAVQTDPRSAYWTLLGRLQARNPSWRNRAQRSFLQALQLDPRDADAHFASAQFFEQLGERERAVSHYQTTVRLDPGHLEAAARLAALGERRAEQGRQRTGLLARWFKRR